MIIAIHNNHRVLSVVNQQFQPIPNITLNQPITKTLITLAETFTNDLIVWCHEVYKEHLNTDAFNAILNRLCRTIILFKNK